MPPLRCLAALATLVLAVLAPLTYAHPASYDDCQIQTGTNASLLVPASSFLLLRPSPGHYDPVAPGDEVAAFTPEGVCAGVLVWNGQAAALSIWADNPSTPGKDGYLPGDPLVFRVWDASASAEYVSGALVFKESFQLNPPFYSDDVYTLHLLIAVPSDSAPSPNTEAADALTESLLEEFDGLGDTSDLAGNGSSLPDRPRLDPNYPNPFHASTTIRYGLPEAAAVRLEVFDALGRRVVVLVDETRSAGWHEVRWAARGLAPGLYVYRLRAGDFVSQRRMIRVR